MPQRQTVVSIDRDAFRINGRPTYPGRHYNGMKVEGLLLNSRMVQATFDDRSPDTRGQWDYPDGKWDPDRNTREFVDAMPEWRRHGLVRDQSLRSEPVNQALRPRFGLSVAGLSGADAAIAARSGSLRGRWRTRARSNSSSPIWPS